MKKTFFIVAIIFVITMVAFIAIALSQNKAMIYSIPLIKKPLAVINNHAFNLYVAKTSKDQQIGLSKYDSLPQDFGMIFIFEKPDYYRFWMKNMKFPIDILFIKDNRIVTIYQNVPSPRSQNENLLIYQPKSKADMVLEIQAGLSQKYNLKEGDDVKLKNL